MSKLSKLLRDTADNGLVFWCPGCKSEHRIQHGEGSGPRWVWNGDATKPTFTPSVLVRSGHYVPGHDGKDCWCTCNAKTPEEDPDFVCAVCHSFVTDGRIRFLSDCTHALAGQTVDLPEWPRETP
jgi:hypothetical protein